ncbi:MAG TPA: hypothetical protein VJ045_11820 [Hyphomicrobiaceae bacterium]|nr:hypothetical protein [Hyphomicrobiaceae bacterium]
MSWALIGAGAVSILLGGNRAEAGSLDGAWSGGGSVSFSSGQKERARCRANYRRASKSSYVVNANCATSSASVAQTATVRGSGNSYQGRFYNAEYDASGTIYVVVHGRSQTVRINSTKGSALLRLSR